MSSYGTPGAPVYGYGDPAGAERGYQQVAASPGVYSQAAASPVGYPQAAASPGGYSAPAYPGYAPSAGPLGYQQAQPYSSGYGAARSVMSTGKPPGLGWVIVGTAVIGALGAFIASNKAKKAAAVGVSATRYWVAFGVTLAVVWVLSIVSYFTFGGLDGRLTRAQLEKSIVAQAEISDANGFAVSATDATCVAASVDSRGAGTYQCVIEFENGARQSYQVTADSDGRWVTSNDN
ncbi:hypothetical protein [Paractinoplanes atraurantiacus]|nr:hypothetical protein [Actinoplanes atraurantiacus]